MGDVVVVLYSLQEACTELHQLDSELSISLRDKVTSRVLLRISFMTPAEVPHLQRLSSEIHTDTSKELSISLPSKECTLVNSSMPVLKPPSPLEIFSQSPPCQKVLLSPTAKASKVTEDLSPEPPVPPLLSSVTPKIPRRPELDFHPVPERPS